MMRKAAFVSPLKIEREIKNRTDIFRSENKIGAQNPEPVKIPKI
jgi:hypothetical protein